MQKLHENKGHKELSLGQYYCADESLSQPDQAI